MAHRTRQLATTSVVPFAQAPLPQVELWTLTPVQAPQPPVQLVEQALPTAPAAVSRNVDPAELEASRLLNLAYYSITRNLSKEDREKLDADLLSRPGEVDPDTGLKPPPWWQGEDDAAASGASFLSNLRRRR